MCGQKGKERIGRGYIAVFVISVVLFLLTWCMEVFFRNDGKEIEEEGWKRGRGIEAVMIVKGC